MKKKLRPSRRILLSGATAASVFYDAEAGERLLAGRLGAMTVNERVKLSGLQMGPRYARPLRGSRRHGEKHRDLMQSALKKYRNSHQPHTKTHKCAAIAKSCARTTVNRHLLRQAERG